MDEVAGVAGDDVALRRGKGVDDGDVLVNGVKGGKGDLWGGGGCLEAVVCR